MKKISVVLVLCIILSGCSANDSSSVFSQESSSVAAEKEELSKNDIESLGKQLAITWQNKWKEISDEKDGMAQAKASVFGFELSNGSILAAITYPCYKTNCTVFYRISDSGIYEYGEYTSGWKFELLNDGENEYLNIKTEYPSSAIGTTNENAEIDDDYYMITENQLKPVISVGRQVFDGETVSWFQYDNEHIAADISHDEYDKLLELFSQNSEVVATVNLDENLDYKNDVFCLFENNIDELSLAIQSLLSTV